MNSNLINWVSIISLITGIVSIALAIYTIRASERFEERVNRTFDKIEQILNKIGENVVIIKTHSETTQRLHNDVVRAIFEKSLSYEKNRLSGGTHEKENS